MPRRGEGKWQALLKDGDVQRWYDNLARGSPATADNYLRVLGRFLDGNGLTSRALLRLKPKGRDDLLADQVTRMADAGLAGSYIEVTKKAVASWLDWNGLRITRKIRVPGASRRPALKDAHIPLQEELRRVLNVAGPKARTAIALMAFAGLRPETMGTYLGDDGLRIGDFVEATVEEGVLTFSTIPAMILVPERLSKTGRPYFTFLGPEGCDYLVAYVRQRAEAGERVTERSPLITPLKVDKDFIRSLNIGNVIRKPMRAAGLKEPPYIWRSYFASRAMLAEGKGLSRDYREFMMGHKGDIAHVYALHKKLPPDTVEAMRQGYDTALEFLETMSHRPRVQRMTSPIRQRIVPLEQLDAALFEGWIFKATLPDGRAIIEGP